jgi:hypothetical protein
MSTTSKLGADMLTDQEILDALEAAGVALQWVGHPAAKQYTRGSVQADAIISAIRTLLARQPAAIDKQDERGAFEAMYERVGRPCYGNMKSAMWLTWQEARAATSANVAQDDCADCDARIRKWRDQFDVMHRRAMNAEANVRELVSKARSVAANVAQGAAIPDGWMLVPKKSGTKPLSELIIAASLACIENRLLDHDDRRELAEYADRLQNTCSTQPDARLCAICNGYGRYQDGNSGTEEDGYAPNIIECECTDEERRHEYRDAAPPAQTALIQALEAIIELHDVPASEGRAVTAREAQMAEIASAALTAAQSPSGDTSHKESGE